MTGPPGVGGQGLRLSGLAHRFHDQDSGLATHPTLRPYLADLAGSHGLVLREEVFAAGAGQAYAELGAPLVESVTGAGEPVDLLVLAYGVHDVQPGRNVALYLSSRCPGDPLAFAVCDQGPAAAFTALRLIADHAATGVCARAVLLVAEQTAVHYPLATPAPVPDRHAAVALLFEAAAGTAPVDVRQHPAVPAEAAAAVLAADVAELAGGRGEVTLVVGGAVELEAATAFSAAEVIRADPGQPYTGLWSRLGAGAPGRLLVLADYDPALGYLCVAALEPSPRLGASAPAGSARSGGGVADMAAKD
ncbi:hypothetical protein [Actinophytocola sp.]|uniref:hypothetical protein n=1 Tax=Actinophytocola sp. TaxID=1872138 RepID=UPI002EDA52D5